ncbi:MAG: PD-(D/E)XK nuclease family protein [archaeon]
MNKKKNIFTYATKELSQDAFLLWLLNNWNSEEKDLRIACATFVCSMIGIDYNEAIHISTLETQAQNHGIDILVNCVVDNIKYVIAIEDKTISHEHGNQLKKYKDVVSKKFTEDYQKVFIFYKTSLMTDQEINCVTKSDWKVYDIKEIHKLFKNITANVKNYLLRSYIEYIKETHETLTKNLSNNINEWDMKNWYNFAFNHRWNLQKNIELMSGNYRNLYYCLQFNLKGQWQSLPYLEIRSRDFKHNKLNIRILLYGLDEDVINSNIDTWKDKINDSRLFKAQNHKKQIGVNIIKDNVSSIEEFKEIANKYISEFYKIIQ